MSWEFATAGRILFGPGSVNRAEKIVREWGSRPAVITGSSTERAECALSSLAPMLIPVAGEPTIEAVRAAARAIRDNGCNVVVGFGGGSAIDAGKAVAALAANSGEPLDYLEVIGEGRALEHAPLPFIAIPTT